MRKEPEHRIAGRANRLGDEKSPYLLQHAGNPVDWYPWGDEAFERARTDDRPIFLSIGYSTCHWCHVMERESFEDIDVASLLNESFVCIKVDREERPDIDGVYMDAAILMSGRGGWPLTIIMTPDGAPFFAATYLPREGRFGMTGLIELLPRIAELWRTRRAELVDTSERVAVALRADSRSAVSAGPLDSESNDAEMTPGGKALGTPVLDAACGALRDSYDDRYGGFGNAPKFPSPHNLLFLLRCHARRGDTRSLEMVTRTLAAMRRGGIYDHVGFGFHRYSTDSRWLVPHFEKMLYDQALLLMAYAEGWRAGGDPLFERTVRETAEYILRDMTAPGGGFYSAEDADSDGVEGKFYVWTESELRDALGADAEAVGRRFGVRPEGNFSDEATGEVAGANILHLPGPPPSGDEPATLPSALRLHEEQPWKRARERLLEVRSTRVRPDRDDKILTDWNGLAIAALTRAGRAVDAPAMVEAAGKAADYVLANARDESGRLLHRIRDGEAGVTGLADDYAFMIWGLIELYDATLAPERLETAISLSEEMVARFWDGSRGGFFLTPHNGERLLTHQRKVYDGAVPSANSVALSNLLRLSHLTGRVEFEERAYLLVRAFDADVRSHPAAYTHFLSGVDRAVVPTTTIVIVGKPDAHDTTAMISAARTAPAAETHLLFVPDDGSSPDRRLIESLAPFVSDMGMKEERATAYVCRGRSCSWPVTDPADVARLIEDPDWIPDETP